MLLAELVEIADRVGATSSRTAKVAELADLFRSLEPDEIEVAVAAVCGTPRQGKVGMGWSTATVDGTAPEPSLTVADLDALIAALGAEGGAGTRARRRALLDDFGSRATAPEAAFVRRLLLGELRHGALAGLASDAVADAAGVSRGLLRRAAMLAGDLPATALLALTDGVSALEAVGLSVGTPVQPMLASTAADVEEALAAHGRSSVEWKLDGVRIQAHRDGDEVRLFTRNLNDVTDRMPSLVAELRALPVHSVVLDGEVLGVEEDGLPGAFQDSMSSFGRRRRPAIGELAATWFDVVHLDGVDLIDQPLEARLDALGSIPGIDRVPQCSTDDPAAANRVLETSLAAGHEGVMVKRLDSTYAAGRRGKDWRKVKPVHTLDLVVLAVEWGSGRRRGWLSNLHLGALDEAGTPTMVGKTFKGLTDELLEWQTARFLDLETRREGHVVHVEPVQVVEIALDGAQVSSRYPGGVALRFARVRRYRDDKAASEADTLAAVRRLLPRSRGGIAGSTPSVES